MALPASAYANLALVQPPAAPKPGARARLAEAAAQRDAELFLKRKIDQANRVLDRLDARGAELGRLIKALQKRKNAAAARSARIEDRILRDMASAKLDKLAGLRATFSMRANAPSLVVDDESLIPEEYIRETIVSQVDKVAIKSALARDIAVAGVHLEQTVSLIRK